MCFVSHGSGDKTDWSTIIDVLVFLGGAYVLLRTFFQDGVLFA